MAAPKTALRASGLLVAVITAALGIIAGPVRAEELDRELVLGDWIDDNGLQWSIAVEEPSGVIPTAAQPPAQKSSAAIEAKQKEVDALKTDTRHYWKNVDTGEILKQPRNQPRNPGLPYFYMGEAPNDAEKVKALTDEIAALQSASGGVPQPPPFRNPGNGLPATVSVKLAGSHMVVFKEGWYDGNSVQARRRITDPADVPADVAIEKTRSEIASKWQPWQWLDFKVIRDPSSGTRLAGNFWSSPFIATEDGTVTRIDPAEATTFNLVRKKQAESYFISELLYSDPFLASLIQSLIAPGARLANELQGHQTKLEAAAGAGELIERTMRISKDLRRTKDFGQAGLVLDQLEASRRLPHLRKHLQEELDRGQHGAFTREIEEEIAFLELRLRTVHPNPCSLCSHYLRKLEAFQGQIARLAVVAGFEVGKGDLEADLRAAQLAVQNEAAAIDELKKTQLDHRKRAIETAAAVKQISVYHTATRPSGGILFTLVYQAQWNPPNDAEHRHAAEEIRSKYKALEPELSDLAKSRKDALAHWLEAGAAASNALGRLSEKIWAAATSRYAISVLAAGLEVVISFAEGGPLGALTEFARQVGEQQIAHLSETEVDPFEALLEASRADPETVEHRPLKEITVEVGKEICVGTAGCFAKNFVANPVVVGATVETLPIKYIKKLSPKKLRELSELPQYKTLGVSLAIAATKGALIGEINAEERAALADYIQKELIAMAIFGSYWDTKKKYDKVLNDYLQLRAREDELLFDKTLPKAKFEVLKSIKFPRTKYAHEKFDIRVDRLGSDTLPLNISIGNQRAQPDKSDVTRYLAPFTDLMADKNGGLVLSVNVEQ